MRRRVRWPAVLAAAFLGTLAIGYPATCALRALGRKDLDGVYRSVREGDTEAEIRRMAGEPSSVLNPQKVREFTGETTPSGTIGWFYYEGRTKSSLIVIFRNGSVVKTVFVRT